MSKLTVFFLLLTQQVDDPLGAILAERRKLERGEFEFSCSTWRIGMAKESRFSADLSVWFDGKSNKTDLVARSNAEQFQRETGITNGPSAKYFYALVPTDGSFLTGAAFDGETNHKKLVRNYDPRSLGLTFTSPVSQRQHTFDALLSRPFILKSAKESGDRIICHFEDVKGSLECHLSKTRKAKILLLRKTIANGEFQVSIEFPRDVSRIDYPEKVFYEEKKNGAVISRAEVIVRRVSANKPVPPGLFLPEKAGLNIGQSVSFEAKGGRGNPVYFWDGQKFSPYQEFHEKAKKDNKVVAHASPESISVNPWYAVLAASLFVCAVSLWLRRREKLV